MHGFGEATPVEGPQGRGVGCPSVVIQYALQLARWLGEDPKGPGVLGRDRRGPPCPQPFDTRQGGGAAGFQRSSDQEVKHQRCSGGPGSADERKAHFSARERPRSWKTDLLLVGFGLGERLFSKRPPVRSAD